MDKVLFIVGPTASGKSAFAIKAARVLDSAVISADSMQIYKGMDIGTAKESPQTMREIKHYMIDEVDPSAEFSVAAYQEAALGYISKLVAQNKIPVVCGGTGLYINSLLYPLSFSDTNKNQALRAELNLRYDAEGGQKMWEELHSLDSGRAEKIHFNDKKRIVRALEICLADGKNSNDFQSQRFDALIIGLNAPRDVLYDRINRRVDLMFDNGLESEVKNLIASGCNFEMQSFQAIGYKEFRPYFEGTVGLEEVKESIKKNTRNYAKRQLTWFRRQDNILWFDSDETDKALETVMKTYLE